MKKKRDVLILSQFFYPEYATTALLSSDLAFGLAKAGLSVDCITGFPQEFTDGNVSAPANEIVNSVNIHRIRYIQTSRKGVYGRIVNYMSFFMSMMANLPRMAKYKVIIAYPNPPMLPLVLEKAVKLFKAKGVFISFDVYPEVAIKTGVTSPNSIMVRVMRHINKKVFKNVDIVVALSTDMKDLLSSSRKPLNSRIEVLPNWHADLVSDNGFKVSDRPLKTEDDISFNVGYFGNMGTCQDMKTILNAMKIMRSDSNVKFIFGGLGVKKDAVRTRCIEYGNGEFKGFLSGITYAENLLSSDCFIVSLDEAAVGLGVPSKTYAYFMAGRPVIAVMQECELSELIVKEKCGFAVKNGDSEGLAKAIDTLKNNPELAKEMGNNARRLYEAKFTLEKGVDNYVQLIKSLL